MRHEYTLLINPDRAQIGGDVEAFLHWLGGPACLVIPGADPDRCRAVVTLLHGNEPSGVRAVYRWLRSGQQPAVTAVFFIASVVAALTPPLFSHRQLAGQPDLNRCFSREPTDAQSRLAAAILRCLEAHQPEAVIDIHNTSGAGPAFAVATFLDPQHDALATLFSDRMILTRLRLGALMEISETLCPTVTIECGGRDDPNADTVAWEGLHRYLSEAEVLRPPATPVTHLFNPVRLELRPPAQLAFAAAPQPDHALTLLPSIDQYNRGTTGAGTLLGWSVLPADTLFRCVNHRGQSVVDQLVTVSAGEVRCAADLQLFMVTTNPVIARSDCLFYAVSASGNEPGTD